MDFREFRSAQAWVKAEFEGTTFNLAYRPREIMDEDIEFLARVREAQLANFTGITSTLDGTLEVATATPNRASRRASTRTKAPVGPPQGQVNKTTIVDYMKKLIVAWDLEWPNADGDLEMMPLDEEHFYLLEPAMRLIFVISIIQHYLDRPNQMTSSTPSSADGVDGPTGQPSASTQSPGATEEAA